MDILPTPFSLAFLMNEKGLKGKGTVGFPSFPFPSMIEGRTVCKKGYDGLLWLVVFHRPPLPSFCIWSKFWFKGKASRAVKAPAYSMMDMTPLRCTCFGDPWTPMHPGASGILCLRGMTSAMCKHSIREQRVDAHCRHLLCSYACSIVPWDLTYKHKFKDKSMKDFKMAPGEPNVGPCEHGVLVWLHGFCTHEASPAVCTCVLDTEPEA